jgi:hypothetical protein
MKQQTDKRRAYRIRVKAKALEMMGSKCERCGYDDARALRLHHSKPLMRGTRGMRRQAASSTSSHLAILRGAKGLSLLCANCSCIATAQDASINANIKRATKRAAARAATR